MQIPYAALRLVGVKLDLATQALPSLQAAADRWNLNSPPRVCGFIAEVCYESEMLTHLEESLYYRDPGYTARIFSSVFRTASDAAPFMMQPEKLANHVYANHYGNGLESSGDGWKYRGRGPIQVTFADNYRAAGIACGRPYLDQPDLLSKLPDGFMAAGWFWDTRNCNALMDRGDLAGVTRKINPAMAGAQRRADLFTLALKAF